MIILQGAIHLFTEQPDAVAKSIYNGLRRQITSSFEYEIIKASTIIQYPHAVSYFCELNLSYDYIAVTYSRKKMVPVLVSIVGKKVNQGLEVEEALRLYWGNKGKCIAQIETFRKENTISVQTEGIEILKNEFKEVFPNCDGVVATLGKESPLCFAEKLSNELGIFLGGVELEKYVKRLSLKQAMPACSLYKSDIYCTRNNTYTHDLRGNLVKEDEVCLPIATGPQNIGY